MSKYKAGAAVVLTAAERAVLSLALAEVDFAVREPGGEVRYVLDAVRAVIAPQGTTIDAVVEAERLVAVVVPELFRRSDPQWWVGLGPWAGEVEFAGVMAERAMAGCVAAVEALKILESIIAKHLP